jgi:hypothetical protein
VAFDRDEHTPVISTVGIAFRDQNGDIYSVSIPTVDEPLLLLIEAGARR